MISEPIPGNTLRSESVVISSSKSPSVSLSLMVEYLKVLWSEQIEWTFIQVGGINHISRVAAPSWISGDGILT